jgi:hypothetical protein
MSNSQISVIRNQILKTPITNIKCRLSPEVANFRFPIPDHWHQETGGAERDRTDDLLLAKQALSQLSYGPGSDVRRQRTEIRSISIPIL